MDRYSTSSGRRPPRSLALPIVIGVVVIVACVIVFRSTRKEPPPAPTPLPVVQATATPVLRLAVVPTVTAIVEYRSDSVVVSAPTYTPTPPPEVPTRAPRRPTAPRSVADCVSFRWSAHQSAAAWGQVLIDIRVVNQCGRTVEPTEVSFWIVGYRDGGVVQTATGHPFRTLFPGRSEEFSVGLPGSIDWYEEITVQIRN